MGIGTPIVAIVALVRSGNCGPRILRLAGEVAALRRQIEQGVVPCRRRRRAGAPRRRAPELARVRACCAEPVAGGPAATVRPRSAAAACAGLRGAAPPASRRSPPAGSIGWARAPSSGSAPITLALSAVFLVRYSIEEGYLSPEVRVILAALFGFALIGGAEKMSSRDERVAQALAAAGIAAVYGALFSAVALYGMISKVAAGGGAMALTAFAIGVSLRHGILVAALAFVGGFASPAIIGSETPNTPVLFGYLLAIAAGTLAVIRHRGWWPLGWGVLAGSALWTVVWMAADVEGLPWVCLFLVAVAGLFVWATWRRLGESENPPIDVAALVWTALAATGVLLGAVIFRDGGQQDAAGWRSPCTASASMRSAAGRRASSMSRDWRRPCRWRRSACGGSTTRAWHSTTRASPG